MTGFVTKDIGILGNASTNALVEIGDSFRTDKSPVKEGCKSFILTAIGGRLGKYVEHRFDKIYFYIKNGSINNIET